MSPWLAECFARIIFSTRLIDKAYRAIDRARSALVLALASDAVLARFNDLAYGADVAYRPDSPSFRHGLFPWEEEIIAAYFPPPPARVLIGGAGGGREALALAERGYKVVAFEPSASLAAGLAGHVAKGLHIEFYRARYEDMPWLRPAHPCEREIRLDTCPCFEAAILGLSSYSHVSTEAKRIQALSSFARYVRGPILISFYPAINTETICKEARTSQLRKFSKRRFGRQPDDRFSINIGFVHGVSATELESAANQSGLKVMHLNDARFTNWPHAVLSPISLAQPQESLPKPQVSRPPGSVLFSSP